MKVREKLEQVRKIVPNGPSPFGQLYGPVSQLQRRFQRVTFWTMYRSDVNTHLIRPHVIETKRRGKTSAEWHDWMSRKLDDIQRKKILPGINRRTGRTYFIERLLGWVGHDSHVSRTAAVGRKWRPPKSQGEPR